MLASPVFRCVKQQLADSEIHLVTKKSFAIVTAHNPYIDHFFYLDDDLNGLITLLKKENYDHIVDLHNNFRSIKIKRALNVKSSTIKKLSLQKILLTQLNINVMPGRHISLRSLDAVACLGVKDDGKGLDYFIAPHDEVPADDIPTSHVLGFIALVIGASYFTKKLPLHKLQALCANIDFPIMLIGGPEDKAVAEAIAASDPVKIYNACGKFTLNESADLIKKSKLVISHDTGMQYIACAYQKRILAIWGATSPALDVEPFFGTHAVNDGFNFKNISVNTWCQPCSKYGQDKCPLGHFNCMEKQDVVAIAKQALATLRR